MLENQANHIALVVLEVEAREAKGVEPTPEAEAAWVEHVTRKTFMMDYQGLCTPGYSNGEGKQDGEGFLEASDPDGAVQFHDMLTRWGQQGEMEGLIVK